jgi:hypothetical protein
MSETNNTTGFLRSGIPLNQAVELGSYDGLGTTAPSEVQEPAGNDEQGIIDTYLEDEFDVVDTPENDLVYRIFEMTGIGKRNERSFTWSSPLGDYQATVHYNGSSPRAVLLEDEHNEVLIPINVLNELNAYINMTSTTPIFF